MTTTDLTPEAIKAIGANRLAAPELMGHIGTTYREMQAHMAMAHGGTPNKAAARRARKVSTQLTKLLAAYRKASV